MKKRKTSKLILTDVLGPKGVKKCKDVKTNRVKILERENQRIEQVHTAVAYFDCRMEKRMDFLVGNTERLLNKTYIVRDYTLKQENQLTMNNRNRKRRRKSRTN